MTPFEFYSICVGVRMDQSVVKDGRWRYPNQFKVGPFECRLSEDEPDHVFKFKLWLGNGEVICVRAEAGQPHKYDWIVPPSKEAEVKLRLYL